MRIVLIGAGGHGKVIADVVRCEGKAELAGFVDADPAAVGRHIAGLPVLGTPEKLPELKRGGIDAAIVTIGDNVARLRVTEQLLIGSSSNVR